MDAPRSVDEQADRSVRKPALPARRRPAELVHEKRVGLGTGQLTKRGDRLVEGDSCAKGPRLSQQTQGRSQRLSLLQMPLPPRSLQLWTAGPSLAEDLEET